jgi:tripartite-type tricarboxylate transporter receptor subunit TctC
MTFEASCFHTARVRMTRVLMTCVLMALGSCAAFAQQNRGGLPPDYPDKPIRVIVGNAPGGGSDLTARMLAHKLGEDLGRNLVVDNRPGAGGIIAMDLSAHAAPDGYTLFVVAGGDLASAFAQKKVSYDVRTAYAPISQLTSQFYLLLLAPQLAVKSVKDLIAYAKSKPGALTFGSSGIASTGHVGLELLKAAAAVDIVHVPYKGIAPALTDMFSGQLQLAFASTISGAPHVRSGRLRALAVTSARRTKSYPDLPSVAETVPGFELTNWYGLFAPARTSAAIVAGLHHIATRALRGDELQAKFSASGAEAAPSDSPAQFKAILTAEVSKWQKIMALPGFGESLK